MTLTNGAREEVYLPHPSVHVDALGTCKMTQDQNNAILFKNLGREA